MQVARIGVEYRHLLLSCLDYTWVAMANMSDVVDRVQVGPPVLVIQVLHPSSYDVERLLIRDTQ